MSEEMNSGVYEIRNRVSGKHYIGSSVNLKARWTSHLSALRHGKHWNSYLQSAFVKYGGEAFELSVLEYIKDISQLISREQYYLDTSYPEYNIALVAGSPMLGRSFSAEHRRKIGMAKMGHSVSAETRAKISAAWPPDRRRKYGMAVSGKRNHNYGKHPSTETLAKRSRALTGHSTSDQTRAKISAAMSGEHNPNYGKHPSAETRAKMSAARMGHPVSVETRLKLSKAMSGTGNPMYGVSGKRNPMYGKRHSKEARKKMSNAKKGSHLNDETRARISAAQKARWRRIHAIQNGTK